MGRACDPIREEMKAYRILLGKPVGKGPLRRPKCICDDNINTVLEKQNGRVWARLIWLRKGTSGWL